MNVANLVLFLMIVVRCAAIEAEVKTVEWGRRSDGQKVEICSLKSAQVEVRAMSYGARLVSIRTADRVGQMSDIILATIHSRNISTTQLTLAGLLVDLATGSQAGRSL
jgi:aldose 1-epimerase